MCRLLWLLGLSFFVIGDGAKHKPPKIDPNEPLGFSRTASFKPGKLGIGADWGKGTVTRIDKGGQGERNGVEVNDIIKEVDDKNYHESLLDKRLAGKLDFDLTFFRPPPQTTGKDDLQPVPDYEDATELDPKSFKNLVYMAANGTYVFQTICCAVAVAAYVAGSSFLQGPNSQRMPGHHVPGSPSLNSPLAANTFSTSPAVPHHYGGGAPGGGASGASVVVFPASPATRGSSPSPQLSMVGGTMPMKSGRGFLPPLRVQYQWSCRHCHAVLPSREQCRRHEAAHY